MAGCDDAAEIPALVGRRRNGIVAEIDRNATGTKRHGVSGPSVIRQRIKARISGKRAGAGEVDVDTETGATSDHATDVAGAGSERAVDVYPAGRGVVGDNRVGHSRGAKAALENPATAAIREVEHAVAADTRIRNRRHG